MRKNGGAAKLMAAVLAFGLVFAGCGRSGSSTSASADSGITVGVCLSSFHAGFMTAVNQAVTDKGKELGITVNVANANGDASVQADNMQNFITQGVSAIVINPIDSNGIIPSIQMANTKGIPVFIIDTNAAGGTIINRNATDNLKAGQTAAQAVAEMLNEKYGEYRGTVVNLCGKISQASGYDRDKGFMDEIAKYSDIKVVFRQDCEFDQEKSMNAMMNALQANDSIDAVFAANDNTALGAVKAIEQSNRFYPSDDAKHIYIVGIDGNPEGIQAIRDGRIDATISQNPITMANNTIQMVYDYIKNGTVPEENTESPQILITKDNIDSAEVKEFGLWADELRTRTGT
ncbi:MAG: sugar ABC transporter substrate-binding protein [Oscillospiraceae bacterium]|nr:sugar ABC transporter substrate-binding protein [Oscillospiraceae bacterium]